MSVVEEMSSRERHEATEYRVNARARASGAAVIDAAGSPILFVGGPKPVGEGLPEPCELLASAFAACLLKSLARSRRTLGFRYDDAVVDVAVERVEKPPRIVSVGYTLRVTTDEPSERLALVHEQLREDGAVFNTLTEACKVDGSVEAVPRT